MSELRRRKGGRGGAAISRPRGSFTDGVWHCECSPPLPAVHFPVKKEGPNKGRWFRTCQKEQTDGSRCRFFLWDTDAAPRENAALAANSRTEPSRATTIPSRPWAQGAKSPLPPYTPEAGPSDTSRKRGHAYVQEEDDEFAYEAGNSSFTDEMNQVLTAVETPSKKPRTEAFATPARRKLPWLKDEPAAPLGMQTPQTERTNHSDSNPKRGLALSNSMLMPSRKKHPDPSSSQTLTPASSPIDTPTPVRFKDVGHTAEQDFPRDVLGLLRTARVHLSEQTSTDLAALLVKYTTIAEGVKKGRDVARASIKAKDAKVTELTYRVNTLEAELEAERAMVQHLQWKADNGGQSE